MLGCEHQEQEAELTMGWTEMPFSFPAPAPSQTLLAIRSPSNAPLLRETTAASLLRNGMNCFEAS